MTYLIVLNLGKGDWQHGWPGVIAQLWEGDRPTPMQFTGSLPAQPALATLYQRWRQLYQAVYAHLGWRQRSQLEFDIDETDLTHVSQAEFHQLCRNLQAHLNRWLDSESFRSIDRPLRTYLSPGAEIRLMVVADHPDLLHLPWCLWDFLTDYPKAEIALSPPRYTRALQEVSHTPVGKVRILAVLGDRRGIDIEHDRRLLEQLPQASLTFLVEPDRAQLDRYLWQPGWDILFFAGHSSSQQQGQIQVNPQESLTIEQLKYSLRTAVANGLKLAIFNSCDGLGLAQDLADLHLPQVIVMAEPVPDRVAQEFLRHFLTAFAGGRSLYASVRQAREKLQALESDFPCASWLPVICQNPAELPPTWAAWVSQPLPSRVPWPTRQAGRTIGLTSFTVTVLLLLLRWLGWLQPGELAAYDALLRLRPTETADSRLLVVTINNDDIQAQGNEPRQGSLSDRTLERLLDRLDPHQPQVIGLDLYRDFPASRPSLARRLQSHDRLVAICKRPDAQDDPNGILPPPEVPEARLSFSDFVQDRDGAIRRHLLFMTPNPASRCTAAYALSTQLALRYLAAQGILPQFTADGSLQLGQTRFPRLRNRTAGYQPVDARGSQILLNYRATPTAQAIAQQVSLTQLLQGQVNPNAIRNRIVLVGVSMSNSGDYWPTPYGLEFSRRVPGVIIHAQMVSQLLSAVLDRRPLLWVWPQWLEAAWVLSWAVVGALLGWWLGRLWSLVLALFLATGFLTGICFLLLLQGGWVPLLPPVLVLAGSSLVYRLSASRSHQPVAPQL